MICDRARKRDIRKIEKKQLALLTLEGVPIRTTTTPCNLGGLRTWFLCPRCSRRCAILYPDLCRLCVDGRYAKESMTRTDRMADEAFKWRHRLGQTSGGIVALFPTKPKWMRWHTYLRLRRRSEALEAEIWRRNWEMLLRSRQR